MVLKSTALEDVDLYRLVENVIHLTKRSTIIDDLLRDRILSCMNAFNNLMDCDMDLAHELARDLTIVRALIKKESEDLERKFSIFERKLRKIANAVLPKDTDEMLGEDTEAQLTTTIFQDNDVRIIDTVNRKSALNKMEEARELVGICKEIIKLANIPSLPIILKSNVLQRMNEMLCLLKLDGGLAIKLKRDILEVRNALQKGDETSEPNLENKMKILKLKLEKCNEELDKREAEYERLIQQLDQQTDRALELFDESIRGASSKRLLPRRHVRSKAREWSPMGTFPNRPSGAPGASTNGSIMQVTQPPFLPPPAQGWMLTPIDPALCTGSVLPMAGSMGPGSVMGYQQTTNQSMQQDSKSFRRNKSEHLCGAGKSVTAI